jgi:hypothetical protein
MVVRREVDDAAHRMRMIGRPDFGGAQPSRSGEAAAD